MLSVVYAKTDYLYANALIGECLRLEVVRYCMVRGTSNMNICKNNGASDGRHLNCIRNLDN